MHVVQHQLCTKRRPSFIHHIPSIPRNPKLKKHQAQATNLQNLRPLLKVIQFRQTNCWSTVQHNEEQQPNFEIILRASAGFQECLGVYAVDGQTNIQVVSETECLFSLPNAHAINHIVVFLLPDTTLPPSHVAAIHYSWPGKPFQYLGYISNEKPSAIFKLSDVKPQSSFNDPDVTIQLGIAVQPENVVQEQLQQVVVHNSATAGGKTTTSQEQANKTVILARKIIQHAFNFVQSFSQGPAGQEVVQLKAFREWWTKFENKMVKDPTFLEREEEN